MSTNNEDTNDSASRFTLIFQNACDEYERLTGHDPSSHPLSLDCSGCNSPKDVLDVLRGRMQAFTRFHQDNQKLLSRLNPIIHLLFTFSTTLGAGIGLAFHPASTIFAGVAVLLGAAKDVIASYDTLESLFGRIHFFLDRLNCYTRMNIRMTTTMTELLGKIMAEVLIILALSTKAIKPKGIIKSVVKTLVGRTDVKNALQRLDTLTKEETVMMVASNREAIYDVEQLINNVRDNVETTKDGDQQQDKLQTWLLPPNPSINHNIVLGTPHRVTANWFFQDSRFRDWKENGSLLWISGNPGVGKSVICSAIIEDIKRRHKDAKALIAYYYFDFRDASKRDLRGLLASLLFQFGQDSDHCCNILYNLCIECRNGHEQPSIVALTECLQSMLSLLGQVPVFIILDALDECPSTTGTWSARDEVMNFVEKLVGSDHSDLHICITSRPEQDIKSILDRLTSPSRRVSLHEEDGQRQDIKSFVRSFVEAVMWRWREEDRELVINTLSQRAHGMFRWVLCQLDTLRRRPPPSIRKALNELPATLDGTYERILQEIPAEKREYTHRLFQCMVSAIRPLQVEELAEIFAIDFDTNRGAALAPDLVEAWRPENPEDEVLSACSTLIAIVDGGDIKVVQFSHFSVKEFLTSHRLRTSGVESIRHYYIPLNSAHTILAQACLTVLLRLDKNIDKKRLATFPLAFYAARHWAEHAKFEDVALRIQGKSHYRPWQRRCTMQRYVVSLVWQST
ncbi:hypothetical protein BC827DRAFT_1153140 [Russula dissimulans]|nr:hypothetical protein BC827DRAFT_1153140 [Russula dissimulans]